MALVIIIIEATNSGFSFAQSRTALVENTAVMADPRGAPELTVCSQNLENYGSYQDSLRRTPGLSQEAYDKKEQALVKRFASAKCDVVAVQELLGRSEADALLALKGLSERLRFHTGRVFEAVVGDSNDRFLRQGFLVSTDRAQVTNKVTFNKVLLPPLSERQRPRQFSRGPVELQISVKGRGGSANKNVNIINIHFKSKSQRGGSDPSQLEWETYRMEMAEALRRIVKERHAPSIQSGESILLIVGDRNSHFDSASARILEGVLTLTHFQGTSPCRLSKRGMPLCQANTQRSQLLFSVLTQNPYTQNLPGTIRYRGAYSWIDDIIMPQVDLPFAWKNYDSPGSYASGVIYSPEAASDHALIYTTLNW